MFDYDYRLEDGAAAFTVSAAGAIGATAQIVSLGEGRMHGEMIIDVTALEIASNNEYYDLQLQGSTDSAFGGTITALSQIKLGAKEVLSGDQDSAVGRYRVPFCTEQPDGTIYPYARVYAALGGSVTTGITFSARLEKARA